MKKLMLLSTFLIAFAAMSFGQTDKMIFHNGKSIDAKVMKVEEFLIIYKYAGEDAEQTVSKLAVASIKYSSGREEQISEKVKVNGKEDWEKVQLLLDKSQIVGLKKVADVQGKTMGFFSGYVSAAGADKRSMRKIMEAAAEKKCEFVYITADKDAKSGAQTGSYGAQGLKKGIAMTY